MRLKGGKVLLDLSDWDMQSSYTKDLSPEEVKAILEKGVSIKVTDQMSHYKVLIDLIPTIIADEVVYYQKLLNDSNDSFEMQLSFTAYDLSNGQLICNLEE